MGFRMNMFRTPKHRQYGYSPQYYNPKQEDLEKRLERAELMTQEGIEGTKARILYNMKRGANKRAYKSARQKALFRSNMLLFALVVILLLAAFYGVEVYLPKLLESWAR